MVTFCGKWRGHIHTGEISAREIDEFVDSCVAAGWDSVAVADGLRPVGQRIVKKWRRAA